MTLSFEVVRFSFHIFPPRFGELDFDPCKKPSTKISMYLCFGKAICWDVQRNTG